MITLRILIQSKIPMPKMFSSDFYVCLGTESARTLEKNDDCCQRTTFICQSSQRTSTTSHFHFPRSFENLILVSSTCLYVSRRNIRNILHKAVFINGATNRSFHSSFIRVSLIKDRFFSNIKL